MSADNIELDPLPFDGMESHYRTILNSIDIGFCVLQMLYDGDGRPVDYRFIDCNAAFEHHTGLKGAVGRTIRELAPGIEQSWFEIYGQVALTGTPVRFEHGSAALGRWYEVHALRVGDPRQRRCAVLFNDISARRRMEDELRVLNTSLEGEIKARTHERDSLWRMSRDPFLISDLSGVWLSVSPAWTDILGWSAEELVGRTSQWMEHPDDQARTADEIGQLASGRSTIRFENRFRARDDTYRWFSWMAVPTDDIIVCVARDITAEKAQAETRLLLEDQLRQSQKMEAVGQLTGGLAHDFNNLLAAISGSLGLMERRLEQGRAEDAGRYVEIAQNAVNRAAALTHRLLAFSRQQTLAPIVTDVDRLVHGMAELIRRTVGPDIDVRVAPCYQAGAALVDANQLENALLNLCINARDAMPDGGRLTIKVCCHHLKEDEALQLEIPADHYVSLCVSDTGTGMTAEVMARAFEPFFTTKPQGQGTGLGLSMIYGFARQSGGHARIRSAPGKGTTVCIFLPRHYGDPGLQQASDETAAPLRDGRGLTILVVDDESNVRMPIVEYLKDLHFDVLEAETAHGALEILSSGVRIDLLISDVGLPGGMSGKQMVVEARATYPDLKVLFITGFADGAVTETDLAHAGTQVLQKPFKLETLNMRIKNLTGG